MVVTNDFKSEVDRRRGGVSALHSERQIRPGTSETNAVLGR